MANILIWFCFFIAFHQNVILGQDTNVTIMTSSGTFIGFQKDVTVDNNVVKLSKFFGIPYAEPPIGERRFQKPVMKAALSEPMVTQSYGPICLQIQDVADSTEWSEDCLTLNIYAPETSVDSPLPVMVWIHGGGYAFGTASIYYGDLLASRGNAIVVTVNYRLGPIGFLNLGDGRESNFGLWDQQLAIQWVHKNIEVFGGDKGRVTIFGESAGAGSVIFQGLYPGNQGLFQRIIAESGSAASSWSETYNYKEEADTFIGLVGCRYSDLDEVLKCLKRVPSSVLNSAVNNENSFRLPLPFAPSVDGDFIKQHPKVTLNPKLRLDSSERRVFGTFDVLAGVNSAEGAGSVSPLYGVQSDPETFLPSRNLFENTLIPAAIKAHVVDENEGLTRDILAHMYTNWSSPEDSYKIRDNFVDMHGDIPFIFPCLQTLDVHKQMTSKSTYMYYFTVDPTFQVFPAPSWVRGSNHGDELGYVFGETGLYLPANAGSSGYADWEKELSKNIMTMWTNFAKTGNPNLPINVEIDWKQYSASKREYLEIGRFMNETSVKERLIATKYNAWNNLLPAVDRALMVNCESETSSTSAISTPSLIKLITVSMMISMVWFKLL